MPRQSRRDDVEVLLDVGISVREVSPDLHPRQMVFRGFVQARRQGVGLGLASGGEATPDRLQTSFQVPWSQLLQCSQDVANFWKANAPTTACRGIFGGA